MREHTSGSTSRRAFVTSGLLSTAALVGASSTAAGSDPKTRADDPERSTPARGVMFPYQFTPGRRATVAATGIDWQPASLEESYRAHVIRYDHAPSLRAVLLTAADRPLEADRSIELGTVEGTPTGNRSFVTVGLESGGPTDG